jgi:hypothetical protein
MDEYLNEFKWGCGLAGNYVGDGSGFGTDIYLDGKPVRFLHQFSNKGFDNFKDSIRLKYNG